jgi:hypothetical protein
MVETLALRRSARPTSHRRDARPRIQAQVDGLNAVSILGGPAEILLLGHGHGAGRDPDPDRGWENCTDAAVDMGWRSWRRPPKSALPGKRIMVVRATEGRQLEGRRHIGRCRPLLRDRRPVPRAVTLRCKAAGLHLPGETGTSHSASPTNVIRRLWHSGTAVSGGEYENAGEDGRRWTRFCGRFLWKRRAASPCSSAPPSYPLGEAEIVKPRSRRSPGRSSTSVLGQRSRAEKTLMVERSGAIRVEGLDRRSNRNEPLT